MTNTKHMVYILKKILYFVFKWKYIFAACNINQMFPDGSPLLLGNKGSMQGQQSRQGTQWSPCGMLVVSMQGNIRAWTRNLKKNITNDSFNFITWMDQRCDIYIFIYFLNYRYNPAKSSILHWIILILAVGNSLNLYIFEFSQFRPDLIAPINFGSRRTSPWSPQVSAALMHSSGLRGPLLDYLHPYFTRSPLLNFIIVPLSITIIVSLLKEHNVRL